MKRISVFLLFCILYLTAQLTPNSVKGTYYLGIPERGKTKVLMEYGKMGEKTVIAVASQKGAMPAVYSYLKEESKTLGVEVFSTAGLYLIQYGSESFIVVQPDGVLGRKIWSKLGYVNIYSKNAQKAKEFNKTEIESFAIDLSSRIMNQSTGVMSHSSGIYHLAVPQTHVGRRYSEYTIEFTTEGKKQIKITPCGKCGIDEYELMPEESEIAGVDIYVHSGSYYLFDLKDGVLIYTFANARGLGKKLWGKGSNYNVYSNNKAYIRQILASKEKQNLIDEMMAGYFEKIKSEKEKRAEEIRLKKVANQKLPLEGLNNSKEKEEALKAAKRWANSWGWKETLTDAYFASNDWTITRNKLTGIITGKVIRGVVRMKHPDGRCRFQYVSFRQDYNGSGYSNLHMTGVGPIYDLKCDNL